MGTEKTGKTLRDLREESIVYVAAELFLRDGIEAVKMTDVAEKAEVGVASLYRYFGTKETLVIRAGALLWRDLHTLFQTVYEAEDFLACSGMARSIGNRGRSSALSGSSTALSSAQIPIPKSWRNMSRAC